MFRLWGNLTSRSPWESLRRRGGSACRLNPEHRRNDAHFGPALERQTDSLNCVSVCGSTLQELGVRELSARMTYGSYMTMRHWRVLLEVLQGFIVPGSPLPAIKSLNGCNKSCVHILGTKSKPFTGSCLPTFFHRHQAAAGLPVYRDSSDTPAIRR